MNSIAQSLSVARPYEVDHWQGCAWVNVAPHTPHAWGEEEDDEDEEGGGTHSPIGELGGVRIWSVA